jgi:hypothetical protein
VADTAAWRPAAAWLALLLFASLAYFMPAPASNELSRFALVRALVERGSLAIDPDAETTADRARVGEHSYSDKAPGASLLAAPAYFAYLRIADVVGVPRPAVARESRMRVLLPGAEDRLFLSPSLRRAVYVCNLFSNALAAAALAAMFFPLLGAWGLPARRALLLTVAVVAGTLLFPYGTVFFGHVLAAAGLFVAFALLERGSPLRAGLAAGTAVLVELPAALGAAVLVGAILTGPVRARALARFALGALPPLLVLAAYQTAAFGRPWSTGYGHLVDPTFAAGMGQGLLGVGWPRPGAFLAMWLGRERGLLYLAPVLIFAVIGLGRGLARPESRRRAAIAGAMVLGFALLSSGYYMWWGGAAAGPRHFIPALPFLGLGLVWLGPWLDRPVVRVAFAVTLGLSIANQLAVTTVSPLAPHEIDLLFEHTWPRLVRGEVAILPGSTNLGLLLGLQGARSLLPLLGLWALGGWTVLGALPDEQAE